MCMLQSLGQTYCFELRTREIEAQESSEHQRPVHNEEAKRANGNNNP